LPLPRLGKDDETYKTRGKSAHGHAPPSPVVDSVDPKRVPVRGLAERLKDVTRNSILTAVVEEARYDVATDEVLIAWHHAGDSGAAEALLSRYRGLARLKARSYFLAGADRDDILQEAMIGLYKAHPGLPGREAGLVPSVRGRLHHATTDHRHQERPVPEARAAQYLRVPVQADRVR
jgi:Sigma-70 region 2